MSQSLIFGSIRNYDVFERNSAPVVIQEYTELGYLRDFIQCLTAVLLAALVGTAFLGTLEKKAGIAMSAACHPLAGEVDAHLKSVQCGAFGEDSKRVGHCWFSSK